MLSLDDDDYKPSAQYINLITKEGANVHFDKALIQWCGVLKAALDGDSTANNIPLQHITKATLNYVESFLFHFHSINEPLPDKDDENVLLNANNLNDNEESENGQNHNNNNNNNDGDDDDEKVKSTTKKESINWVSNWIHEIFSNGKHGIQRLHALTLAANYLAIPSLLNVCVTKLAQVLDKTLPEIAELLRKPQKLNQL